MKRQEEKKLHEVKSWKRFDRWTIENLETQLHTCIISIYYVDKYIFLFLYVQFLKRILQKTKKDMIKT